MTTNQTIDVTCPECLSALSAGRVAAAGGNRAKTQMGHAMFFLKDGPTAACIMGGLDNPTR